MSRKITAQCLLSLCVLGLVASTTSYSLLYARLRTTTPPPQISNIAARHNLSPEIVNELKEFLQLIPTATLDEVVAKYFIIDSGFRTALAFVRSAAFETLLDHLLDIPDVLGVLDYVGLLVNETNVEAASKADDASLWANSIIVNDVPIREEQLVILLLQPRMQRRSKLDNDDDDDSVSVAASKSIAYRVARRLTRNDENRSLHSFTDFVRELLQHLSRHDFVRMIQQKRARSAQFNEFYTALRSLVLPVMVDNALKSMNLRPVVQELAAHSINAKELRNVAFEVISWGPVV